ncbi:MAG: DUF3108 domain-containing protein [Chloroflexi bacterium]|nr:DUF3108 domain-containing protein [Chloroflexota bacterium]
MAFARRVRSAGLAMAVALVATCAAACADGTGFPEPSDPVGSTPWPDYELLRYDITDQTGARVGGVDFEVERRGDEYRLRVLFLLPETATEDETVVFVDAASLRPLRYERLATTPGERVEVRATYGVGVDGQRFVDSVVVDGAGDRREERLELEDFSFDTDSSAWLWRTLPFALDLELSYRNVNVFAQRTQLVGLRVRGQDEIHTPVGDFLAWQLEVRPGVERQTVWFAVDAPHILVRWDLEPRRYLLSGIVTERPAE